MPEKITCPFCNFPTTYPVKGKVFECEGECFATYTIVEEETDLEREKMSLVEIFFLDGEFNLKIRPDEVDSKCEFRTLPAAETNEYIMFAREHRMLEDEIDRLETATPLELEVGIDTMERLHSSLDRFERNLRNDKYPREKLANEIKVLEALVQKVREKIERE